MRSFVRMKDFAERLSIGGIGRLHSGLLLPRHALVMVGMQFVEMKKLKLQI
jgi:hypothetical protein